MCKYMGHKLTHISTEYVFNGARVKVFNKHKILKSLGEQYE